MRVKRRGQKTWDEFDGEQHGCRVRGGLRQTRAAAAEARHPLEKAGGNEAFREGLRILREIDTLGCAGRCCWAVADQAAAAASCCAWPLSRSGGSALTACRRLGGPLPLIGCGDCDEGAAGHAAGGGVLQALQRRRPLLLQRQHRRNLTGGGEGGEEREEE